MSAVSWLYPFWVLVCRIQTNAKLCILSGIYRVNYNTHNWELLATTLKENPSSIHHLNRAQVIKNLDHVSKAPRDLKEIVLLTISESVLMIK